MKEFFTFHKRIYSIQQNEHNLMAFSLHKNTSLVSEIMAKLIKKKIDIWRILENYNNWMYNEKVKDLNWWKTLIIVVRLAHIFIEIWKSNCYLFIVDGNILIDFINR